MVVDALLEAGADPNQVVAAGSASASTALTRAVDTGQPAVVLALLESDADPNLGKWTPLLSAATNRSLELTRMLLEAGADPTICGFRGRTPLHQAAGNPAVVRLLLEFGADVDARDDDGETPLISSVRPADGPMEVDPVASVHFLLEAGANVDVISGQGETALTTAARSGRAAAVRLLLEAGAERGLAQGAGMTALAAVRAMRQDSSLLGAAITFLSGDFSGAKRRLVLRERWEEIEQVLRAADHC